MENEIRDWLDQKASRVLSLTRGNGQWWATFCDYEIDMSARSHHENIDRAIGDALGTG